MLNNLYDNSDAQEREQVVYVTLKPGDDFVHPGGLVEPTLHCSEVVAETTKGCTSATGLTGIVINVTLTSDLPETGMENYQYIDSQLISSSTYRR